MADTSAPESASASILHRPLVRAVGTVVASLLVSAYVLYLTPVAALVLLYRGRKWYFGPDPERSKAGVLLLLSGFVFFALSYLVFSGLIYQPVFEQGR